MQSSNQTRDSISDHIADDPESFENIQDEQLWDDSVGIMFELSKYGEAQEDAGEFFRIAAEVIQGSNGCDLAILATDQQGYVVAGSSGIEAILQLPVISILNRDIVTIFTDEKFQQEITSYLGKRDTLALNKYKLKQVTDTGTLFLDISIQRLCCSKIDHIGFLCFAKDVTNK